MERSEFLDFDDAERTPPSPAARRLATLVAQRLDAVVPRPFRVVADGGNVVLYAGERWETTIHLATLLDQGVEPGTRPGEWGSFAWNVTTAVGSVLNNLQDGVSEGTTEPWPRLVDGGMATYGARIEDERIVFWYGPTADRETDAVMSFAPIALDEIRD